MLPTHNLGIQIIHYAASLPPVAEGLRPFLIEQATRLKTPGIAERDIRKIQAAFNAVLASPMCRDLTLDKLQPFELATNDSPVRFDRATYNAALDYYGQPRGYKRVFAKRLNGEGLEQVTPEYAAETNRACWIQINDTAPNFPIKKPSKADITKVRNIQLDFEYPPDPKVCHNVGIELNYRLAELGYIPSEGLPIVEDSGAGPHLVLPVVPFDTAPLGGGELVSQAIGEVVRRYFEPEFNRIAKRYHLDKSVKLDAYEISRIFSVPGTWRPFNPKKDINAAPHLLDGYLRRWLPPYVKGIYPTRKESQVLTDLVKAECARLQEELANPPAIEKRVIITDANQKRIANFFEKVLQTHCDRINDAPKGERHNTAYTSAKVMGGHLAGSAAGILDENEVERRLLTAKLAQGADKRESIDVIQAGIKEGKKQPLYLEED